MRPFAITDKKVLKEQQSLVEKYMAEAPEDTDLHDYILANCSEYFTQFYKKTHEEKESEDYTHDN